MEIPHFVIRTVRVFLCLGTAVVCIYTLSKIVLWTLLDDAANAVEGKVTNHLFGYSNSLPVENYRELTAINSDHFAVADWVAHCIGMVSALNAPEDLRGIFDHPIEYFIRPEWSQTQFVPNRAVLKIG